MNCPYGECNNSSTFKTENVSCSVGYFHAARKLSPVTLKNNVLFV